MNELCSSRLMLADHLELQSGFCVEDQASPSCDLSFPAQASKVGRFSPNL